MACFQGPAPELVWAQSWTRFFAPSIPACVPSSPFSTERRSLVFLSVPVRSWHSFLFFFLTWINPGDDGQRPPSHPRCTLSSAVVLFFKPDPRFLAFLFPASPPSTITYLCLAFRAWLFPFPPPRRFLFGKGRHFFFASLVLLAADVPVFVPLLSIEPSSPCTHAGVDYLRLFSSHSSSCIFPAFDSSIFAPMVRTTFFSFF